MEFNPEEILEDRDEVILHKITIPELLLQNPSNPTTSTDLSKLPIIRDIDRQTIDRFYPFITATAP
jgi:hypothetical protein